MYKIFADDTLIYDSTIDDYKIIKGSISLEINKSGSFSFSIYPDHFYYDNFVKLKTVITVYKSDKIVFRGRILNDVTDYWNNKNITCEGELGFLQDSIIRPFSFTGTPENLFKKFVEEHNSQVDNFKKFKVGTVTVVDPNNYIARGNSEYESALNNLNSRLIENSIGGYLYITHGDDGTDPIPTINYLADFTKVSSQKIEFGANLKNYTKTVKATDIATAIIPLGCEIDDEDETTENKKLTIESVNDGRDYVYSEEGVALYGWIFKTVSFDDVTVASNLKKKAEDYLNSIVQQVITIELNAIDLHLLDSSIESFSLGDYIQVISTPHNFDSVLLCSKMTLDILKPDNDIYILGHSYSSFIEIASKVTPTMINRIEQSVNIIPGKVNAIGGAVSNLVNNIYYPDTEQINGEKIHEESITSDKIDLKDVFAKNIIMTGQFTTYGEVFLEPGEAEIATIEKHILREELIPDDKIPLYDFNGDGNITVSDFMRAKSAMIGQVSLSTWAGAQKSLMTITINISDPQKAIRLYGVNMWGRTIDTHFGANTLFSGDDAYKQFSEMVKNNEYIAELETRIAALENNS